MVMSKLTPLAILTAVLLTAAAPAPDRNLGLSTFMTLDGKVHEGPPPAHGFYIPGNRGATIPKGGFEPLDGVRGESNAEMCGYVQRNAWLDLRTGFTHVVTKQEANIREPSMFVWLCVRGATRKLASRDVVLYTATR
jgi:hypothetical protein